MRAAPLPIADDAGEKRCCRCELQLPADREFFFSDRNSEDGLANTCKACIAETRDRQIAGAATDPRLEVLRQAIRAGLLAAVTVKEIFAFFRAQGLSAPDGRVVARFLELLERERLVCRDAKYRKRRYCLSPLPAAARTQPGNVEAAVAKARSHCRTPAELRQAPPESAR